MHAYPLWGDPYIFADGSEPEPALREQMVNYSWGIPIETFKQFQSNRFAVRYSKLNLEFKQ